ncbi:hypothetical protein BDV12DRAFT_193506 [Aspergillus spectabilis]
MSEIDKLRAALETPQEKILKLGYGHYLLAMVRVAQGTGIFDAFAQSSLEITLPILSRKTKGNEDLLIRVMRFLCAYNVFENNGEKVATYQATPLALALANGTTTGDTFKHLHNILPISAKLHAYFEKTSYENPDDAYNGPLQFALDTKDHYFAWLNKDLEVQSAFNTVMGFGRRMRNNWFEMYPVMERLSLAASTSSGITERVLIVDIGGNRGHELAALKAHFPPLQGRLVLEDLPSVIDNITESLDENIRILKYSMFDPQPIQGAKAYYMRTVLLDWPDKQALEILRNIREAMASDSVLLVYDLVYPDRNVPGAPASAILDLMMMECFSASVRTEKEWVDLLVRAGFRVEKVWEPEAEALFSVALFKAVVEQSI